LERSVEVLRQLEVFDDITALIDSQPVVSFRRILINLLDVIEDLQCSCLSLQAFVCTHVSLFV
jgi:hypothetical protein